MWEWANVIIHRATDTITDLRNGSVNIPSTTRVLSGDIFTFVFINQMLGSTSSSGPSSASAPASLETVFQLIYTLWNNRQENEMVRKI